MSIQPTKEIEGFELLEDVIGKTGLPIMKKGTIISEGHLIILQKFLVDKVEAAPRKGKKSSSKLKEAKQTQVNEKKSIEPEVVKKEKVTTFFDDYIQAVSEFKKEYLQWVNGVPINIIKVRQLILPLLDKIKKLDMEPFLLFRLIDRKEYIFYHSVAVSILSAFMASHLEYDKGNIIQIALAALLSDAGMAKIDQDIIRGGGPLTTRQTKELHNHPVYSAQMINNLTTITMKAEQAVLQHHERIDGSGYPMGLIGSAIHPYALIIAVSDSYYAMTSPRLYKEKMPVFQVLEELNKDKHARLDGDTVNQLLRLFSKRAVGKKVRLSDQSIGEIVYMDKERPTEILIKLEQSGEVISKQNNSQLYVEDFIV